MVQNGELRITLQDLEKKTLTALDEIHDYYTYTKRVWRSLQKDIKQGRKFTLRNPVTKAQVTEQDLREQVQIYITGYLMSSTFQHFVSLFEHFFFELLHRWLVAYPQSLSKKQVEFRTILNAVDTAEIIQAVVDKELNDIKYKSIADWFEYLQKLIALECPTREQIEQLTEIKASRDILAHNNGIVNETYLRKAGAGHTRFMEGEILEISEQYLLKSWATTRKMIQDLSQAVQAKA